VTLLARLTFAALVLATFGAFFATQRLKRTPPPVNDIDAIRLFSPNSDGRFDRARVSFTIKKDDDVTVDVISTDGDRVRRIADGRRLRAYRRLSLPWDGRNDAGRLVRDGTYRYRVALRREGRTVTLPYSVRKDVTPPRPRVMSIGPTASTVPAPEMFPNRRGEPMRVRLFVPGRNAGVLVYRTDTESPSLVLERRVPAGDTVWTWDGTGEDGSSLPSGTYVVVARSRDKAGNIGTSPSPLPPKPAYGRALGGKGGVQIMSLAAAPPSGPVEATADAGFLVVNAGRRYAWQVRRVGEPEPRSRGTGTRSRVVLQAPGGKSGLYLFEVRTANRAVQVPFAVQSVREERVLVILPSTTWQGRNKVDDDGDGWPDTLEDGLPVRTARPYVGGGLPAGVAEHVAPLLAAIDRAGLRYDITTDVALARGQGPKLEGHTGVVLAGDTTWMDGGLQRSLRAWVRAGGRVLQTGTGSLRRSVQVTRTRIEDPTQATARDLFGVRLANVVPSPGVTLTNTVDRIGLFTGTDGVLGPFSSYEATASVGADSSVLAVASTPDAQSDVLVASRFGDGVVVRLGVPDLPSRLSSDPELVTLLNRIWTLLQFRR
jgi:flagellar hook assembly protein FlgD